MSNENKALIREYFTALSGREKTSEIVNIYVADKNLKKHITTFEAAFPRYELIAEDMVSDGDKVAVRATFRGWHKGELLGIAPTGKEATISLMLIYRILNGKIIEHWMVADQYSLMQQLRINLSTK